MKSWLLGYQELRYRVTQSVKAFHPAVRDGSPARSHRPLNRSRRDGRRSRAAVYAHPRADRKRQDAGGIPLVPQPSDVRAATAAQGTLPRPALPRSALAVDVERNLQAPLAGIANVARRLDVPVTMPEIAIRTGDTPAGERARFLRDSADILITTPESLFLLLTSNARALATVDTVIVDEIHALVPTKRGTPALSLERLEALRAAGPLQRIGLSATQRPLDEVARFLGGTEEAAQAPHRPQVASAIQGGSSRRWKPRSMKSLAEASRRAVEAGHVQACHRHRCVGKKQLKLRIDVPVEDMARVSALEVPSGPASGGAPSIWASIHRLLDLIVRTARPCCSSTAGGSPNVWPARSTSCRRTADPIASAARCPRSAQRSRRPAEGRPHPRARGPHRSNWVSTWEPSTWSSRSRRRPRWRAGCSA